MATKPQSGQASSATKQAAAKTTERRSMDQNEFAKTYPRVAERCQALGLDRKATYSVVETVILLGQSTAWVRKQVTGYRGKGLSAAPQLKARKEPATGAWRVDAESIETKLGEIYETQDRRQDRFANPQKYLAEERGNGAGRAIRAVRRIAAEAGLTREQMDLLDAIATKLE